MGKFFDSYEVEKVVDKKKDEKPIKCSNLRLLWAAKYVHGHRAFHLRTLEKKIWPSKLMVSKRSVKRAFTQNLTRLPKEERLR